MSAGAAPRVRHRFVVRHPQTAAVLLERGAGGWRLPAAELEDRHTAEVEHVNDATRRWGLTTTALRGLGHRVHELECHEPVPDSLPATMRWLDATEVDLDADDAGALLRAGEATPAGCGWMKPGWWAGVRAWIEGRLGPGEIVQTRCWESSCVARCEPRRGERFFFKAVAAAGEREVTLTAHLAANRYPGAPDVVAADAEHRWFLMRAFDGASLDDSREPGRWRRAARVYGRLQAMSADRVAELRALGCPERAAGDFDADLGRMLADEAGLLADEAAGLGRDEIAAMRRLEGEWRRCARLVAAGGPPLALDHGDLWPSNLLVDDRTCTVIDWEDAALAPPFPSLAPFLALAREWRVAADFEPIAAAYLPAFGRPAELRPIFDAAVPVGFVDLALRYWRLPAAVKEQHPWMREMVPFFLRHAVRG